MEVTHLLKSCICLPCVSPSFSCIEVIVNDVTATVWKNTVRRGTSNKLDIACPIYWGCSQAKEQRNKQKSLKGPVPLFRVLCFICQCHLPWRDIPNSLLYPEGFRRQTKSLLLQPVLHHTAALSAVEGQCFFEKKFHKWSLKKTIISKDFLIVIIQNYYSNICYVAYASIYYI